MLTSPAQSWPYFICQQSQLLHLPHFLPSMTGPELAEGTALLQGGGVSITTCAHGVTITLRALTPSCINLDPLQTDSAARTAGAEGKVKVFHRRHLARCTGKLARGKGTPWGKTPRRWKLSRGGNGQWTQEVYFWYFCWSASRKPDDAPSDRQMCFNWLQQTHMYSQGVMFPLSKFA